MKWITNAKDNVVPSEHFLRLFPPGILIKGPPRHTEYRSVETLTMLGLVGWYLDYADEPSIVENK